MNRKKKIEALFKLTADKVMVAQADIKRSEREWIELFSQALTEAEIPFFVVYGSCLGAVREGAKIEYDDDFDIGIKVEYLPQVAKIMPKLEGLGIFSTEISDFHIRFEMPNSKMTMDIWTIEKVTNIFFRIFGFKWLVAYVYSREDYFSDPAVVKLWDKEYFAPSPVIKYIESLYGKNWRIPLERRLAVPRGYFSQLINKPFVDFEMPGPYSGAPELATFKPWVSKILKRFFPNSKITSLFKHPS
jgi:hypothetical protein